MRCRIAGFLHIAPSAVDDLPAHDFDMLCRYFAEEPWGPIRDNIHAAMICREIVRTSLKNKRQRIDIAPWMLEHPEKRRRGHLAAFVQTLRAMSGGIKKHVSEVRRPVRRRRKKGPQ